MELLGNISLLYRSPCSKPPTRRLFHNLLAQSQQAGNLPVVVVVQETVVVIPTYHEPTLHCSYTGMHWNRRCPHSIFRLTNHSSDNTRQSQATDRPEANRLGLCDSLSRPCYQPTATDAAVTAMVPALLWHRGHWKPSVVMHLSVSSLIDDIWVLTTTGAANGDTFNISRFSVDRGGLFRWLSED